MGPEHDIGWAIGAIKHNKAVRRPHWGEGFCVTGAHINVAAFTPDNGVSHHSIYTLFIHMPSLNRVQPFTCHHDDLLATDWELA